MRAPQPETVRDYTVSATREIAAVKNNFQRVNRHDFPAIETNRVRIEIQATNGIEEARIFEVRSYA